MAQRLHFGDFGVVMKLVWVHMGVVPALLAVTGALMWWNRVLSKKFAQAQRKPQLATSAGQLDDAA